MSIADRFQSLPRAARWGILAGGIFVSYFAIVEPMLDAINRANSAADDRATALTSLAKGATGGTSELALGIRKFGDISLPGDPDTRSVALNRRVSDVLKKHNIKDSTSTSRVMPLGQGPLKDVYGESERIDRLIREVVFDATPEDIAGVISDLESSPEVAAISRVQIRRGDNKDTAGRILKATVAAEAWEVVRKGRGR